MTTITQTLPVITITADQVGPLGITLSAAQLDPGGNHEPADLLFIPILDLGHYDERQSCGWAHEYLDALGYAAGLPAPAATDLPAYHTCTSYRAGMCGGNGWQDPCLFDEPATSEGWARVRRWRLLPDGGICLVDSYAELLADQRAWPAAKPFADLVAHSYNIAADARGAVLAERRIITTGADLALSLAWCLALVGCDEDEIPNIIAVYAPAAAADPDALIDLPASSIYGALCAAALHGVRLAETEAQLARVAL
jgi:hypothetical protein